MKIATCRACKKVILVKSGVDAFTCPNCKENTAIGPANPGRKYILCLCNYLIICVENVTRVICPRETCRRLLAINGTHVTVLPTPMKVRVRSLVELATRSVMIRGDDNTYQVAARFMRLAGLAPDYIRLLRTTNNKLILMTNFPFADVSFVIYYASIEALLHIVEQLREWRVKRLEFDNFGFSPDMLDLLENVLPKTKARSVSLINCTFTGFYTGTPETRRLLTALGCGTGAIWLDTSDVLYNIMKVEMRSMRSLLELATRSVMIQRDDNTYQVAVQFMCLAGLAPDCIRLLRTTNNKLILMTNFPFADVSFSIYYASIEALLHTVEQLVEWRMRRLEFDNFEFSPDMLDLLENVLPKTKARSVSLINCTFTGFSTGTPETRRLHTALGCGAGAIWLDTSNVLYNIMKGSSNGNNIATTNVNSVPISRAMQCTLL